MPVVVPVRGYDRRRGPRRAAPRFPVRARCQANCIVRELASWREESGALSCEKAQKTFAENDGRGERCRRGAHAKEINAVRQRSSGKTDLRGICPAAPFLAGCDWWRRSAEYRR